MKIKNFNEYTNHYTDSMSVNENLTEEGLYLLDRYVNTAAKFISGNLDKDYFFRNIAVVFTSPGVGTGAAIMKTLRDNGLSRGINYTMPATADKVLDKAESSREHGHIFIFDDADDIFSDRNLVNMVIGDKNNVFIFITKKDRNQINSPVLLSRSEWIEC